MTIQRHIGIQADAIAYAQSRGAAPSEVQDFEEWVAIRRDYDAPDDLSLEQHYEHWRHVKYGEDVR